MYNGVRITKGSDNEDLNNQGSTVLCMHTNTIVIQYCLDPGICHSGRIVAMIIHLFQAVGTRVSSSAIFDCRLGILLK